MEYRYAVYTRRTIGRAIDRNWLVRIQNRARRFPGLVLFRHLQCVWMMGRRFTLTPRECDCLAEILNSWGSKPTTEVADCLESRYGNVTIMPHSVSTYLSQIRQKLNGDGAFELTNQEQAYHLVRPTSFILIDRLVGKEPPSS